MQEKNYNIESPEGEICSCQKQEEKIEERTEEVIESKKIKRSIKPIKEKFLSSRKFIAYIVAVNVGLVGFCFLYYQSKEAKLFTDYLDFVLWSLVAYTGGNTVSKVSDKFGRQE